MTNRVLAGYGYGSCTFSFGMGKVSQSFLRKKFRQILYNYFMKYSEILKVKKVCLQKRKGLLLLAVCRSKVDWQGNSFAGSSSISHHFHPNTEQATTRAKQATTSATQWSGSLASG